MDASYASIEPSNRAAFILSTSTETSTDPKSTPPPAASFLVGVLRALRGVLRIAHLAATAPPTADSAGPVEAAALIAASVSLARRATEDPSLAAALHASKACRGPPCPLAAVADVLPLAIAGWGHVAPLTVTSVLDAVARCCGQRPVHPDAPASPLSNASTNSTPPPNPTAPAVLTARAVAVVAAVAACGATQRCYEALPLPPPHALRSSTPTAPVVAPIDTSAGGLCVAVGRVGGDPAPPLQVVAAARLLARAFAAAVTAAARVDAAAAALLAPLPFVPPRGVGSREPTPPPGATRAADGSGADAPLTAAAPLLPSTHAAGDMDAFAAAFGSVAKMITMVPPAALLATAAATARRCPATTVAVLAHVMDACGRAIADASVPAESAAARCAHCDAGWLYLPARSGGAEAHPPPIHTQRSVTAVCIVARILATVAATIEASGADGRATLTMAPAGARDSDARPGDDGDHGIHEAGPLVAAALRLATRRDMAVRLMRTRCGRAAYLALLASTSASGTPSHALDALGFVRVVERDDTTASPPVVTRLFAPLVCTLARAALGAGERMLASVGGAADNGSGLGAAVRVLATRLAASADDGDVPLIFYHNGTGAWLSLTAADVAVACCAWAAAVTLRSTDDDCTAAHPAEANLVNVPPARLATTADVAAAGPGGECALVPSATLPTAVRVLTLLLAAAQRALRVQMPRGGMLRTRKSFTACLIGGAVRRILSLLHARDERRPFVAASLWHTPDDVCRALGLAAHAAGSDASAAAHAVVSVDRSRPGAEMAPPVSIDVARRAAPLRPPTAVRVLGGAADGAADRGCGGGSLFWPFFVSYPSRLNTVLRAVKALQSASGGLRVAVTIDRRNELHSALVAFEGLGAGGLAAQLRVEYVGEAGAEAGIDLGGMSKDLITNLARTVFSPATGLFESIVAPLSVAGADEIATSPGADSSDSRSPDRSGRRRNPNQKDRDGFRRLISRFQSAFRPSVRASRKAGTSSSESVASAAATRGAHGPDTPTLRRDGGRHARSSANTAQFSPLHETWCVDGAAAPVAHAPRTLLGIETPRLARFAGVVAAKAALEGILLPSSLSPVLLCALNGGKARAGDLALVAPELWRHLVFLRGLSPDVLEALGLVFAVDEEVNGQVISVPLMRGGGDVDVTAATLDEYLMRLAEYKLNKAAAPIIRAFVEGFWSVLPLDILRWLSAREINAFLCGVNTRLSIDDLFGHVCYSGGYKATSRTIVDLRSVLEEFTDEQQSLFLQFVTSCPRAPLGGFEAMRPPLTIRREGRSESGAASAVLGAFGVDYEALPSSSTCFNLLKLPPYRLRKTLRDKLLLAITSRSGFDLS